MSCCLLFWGLFSIKIVIRVAYGTLSKYYKWAARWDFQQNGMCDQQSLRSACAYAKSNQSLCLSLEYSMSVKLLTEHLLESLSLKGGCTGSSECTLVNMSNRWKSHTAAQIIIAASWEITIILNEEVQIQVILKIMMLVQVFVWWHKPLFTCNMDIMRQSACLSQFKTWDSMTALMKSFNRSVRVWCLSLVGSTATQLWVFFSSEHLWVVSPLTC